MAEEEMDVATSSETEVSNHVEADGKLENHGKNRTADNEFVEKQANNQEVKVTDEENCSSVVSSDVLEKSEGAASNDEITIDVGTSLDDDKVDKTATMECKGQSDKDVITKDAESDMDKGGMSTEGGVADEGMASEDASNAASDKIGNKKLSENPKSQLVAKERKTRLVKRCLRHREPCDQSDSSEEHNQHDTEGSGTRSPPSHSSNSDATESDMEREANDDEPRENTESDQDRDNKSATEIGSDLEDELLAKLLPKPNWRAIPMLRARELGEQKSQTCFSSKSIGSVHLVSRFEKYCELKHHEGCVNTLHFNQSGRLLASGSDDLNIVLWDWAQEKTTLVYPSGHRSNVFQAKFMPFSGDTTLVSCARDGQVRVGELSSTGICKSTKKLVQHKGAAHKLGLEPDSPVVFLTCGEDAAVFNIDLRTSKATKLVTVKEEVRKVALYTIFVNPMDTNEFCVGGRDHFVRIYDRRKVSEERDGPLKKYCPHHLLNSETRANVTCCVYSYNGGEILASYNDEDIYLFDNTHSDGAEFVRSYKGHRNNQTVKGVNFYGPQSQFVVSGSDCGNIFLWEKNTEKIVQYMKGDNQGVVNCLEAHPTSAVLATSGLDHDVKIWMPTAAEPTRLEGLKRTMYSNRRDREEDRSREPDMIDGHMLMFLMQHLRRRARRQAREAGDLDSDSSSSDSDSSDDEDGEGSLPGERSQCAPS